MKRCHMELYLTLSKIQILETLTSQSDLDYQDKKFRLFPAILYYFTHFRKLFIVQSIWIPVSLQLINFLILKNLFTGKVKDALNSLELTSGNCDEAVVILKSRFGD